MNDHVSLRERVREHPAEDVVHYLNRPKLEEQLRTAFEPQMRIHLAHTVMLARQGIIRPDEARAILEGLREIRNVGPGGMTADPTLEDLYSHVERELIRRIGADVGGRMHTGRSRNDLGVTQARLVLRAEALDLIDRVIAFERTLIDLARKHVETVMPGLTHSQHAQVATLGYYFAALGDVLGRDRDRLEAAYGRTNRGPLGAAALTTTGFPLDRHLTARLLGFDGLVENGYDAIVSRDDVGESAAAVALLAAHLSRLAEDLWLWSTLEFGYVELADRYAAVSSIMPQKKNPILLEKIRGMAAEAVGAATTALGAEKGVSFSECDDAQTGGTPALHRALALAMAALDLLRGALASATFRRERMRHLAEIGFATMTELADAIVREKDLSFRMAHNIVGRVVAQAVDEGKSALEITTTMLDEACQALFDRPLGLAEATLQRALDPWENIRVRRVTGGPAPEEMARMLEAGDARVAEAAGRQQARRDRIATADADLEREVAALL